MADSTKVVNVIVFAVAVLLWAGFAVLLLNRQGNLNEISAAFRGQSWILQTLEVLIFLPGWPPCGCGTPPGTCGFGLCC